jgi:thioester reductase-like protein
LDQAPVVGILAHSGLPFIITLLGLSRLGYASLLLSTRLAAPALIRLLELADCNTLLTTSHFHPVLKEVKAERDTTVLELLKHEEYYAVEAPSFDRAYNPYKETAKNIVIIHSSGSTGLPKPIYLTNRSCIAAFSTNLDRKALMTQPLFHSFGFYETFRSIYSGKPMYYFNYAFPLTKQNITATLEAVKPDLLFCVPYVLKLLGEYKEGIEALAKIDLVMYGGSACPDDLGDMLVKNGVNLVANYGATETGRLSTSVRPAGDYAWNYLRLLPQVKEYVLMDEIAPGIFECVALDGLKSKNTINSEDPPRSFRTRDLFVRHPTNPDFWRFVSRLDDRLTLTNGEKVLPIPIEGRIRQEGLVKEAVVFGDGKSLPGILIVKADSASGLSDTDFREQIWPAVEDANSRAESFSRIPKELVVVLPADVSYAKTDKGTFIRAQVYLRFKDLIETSYTKFEGGGDDTGTVALPLPELEIYLLQQFQDNLSIKLSVADDFFALGIDSLQCMKMWSLMRKELDLGGRQSQLGQNVLYETGNVQALARYIDGLRTGRVENAKDTHQIMRELILKHSSFKMYSEEYRTTPQTETVILTGVTGGLGAHLLSQLVRDPTVSTVWALVRASSEHAALERTLQSLSSRGICLSVEEIRKIIAVPSDLSKPDFGLGASRLVQLRSSLTLVIHSAWAVNFNISVGSFEDQHIKAVPNFINLCQSTTHGSPARFYFCSSVSSTGGTPRPGTVPETPVRDIAHVQSTGYAQSKYVAEEIVRNAMKDAGAQTRVLRIGQLVGDSKAGEWNTTEGIPLMIQTAVTLGALPQLDEVSQFHSFLLSPPRVLTVDQEMTWLPVDHAASIILDVCKPDCAATRTSDPDLVYHVLNPKRFHWTRDMLPALSAAGLQFESLSTEQWMDRLRNSDRDPKKNPPIKLLDWFESKYGSAASTKPKGPLEYLTKETGKDSVSLGQIPSVTDSKYMSMVIDRLKKRWAE